MTAGAVTAGAVKAGAVFLPFFFLTPNFFLALMMRCVLILVSFGFGFGVDSTGEWSEEEEAADEAGEEAVANEAAEAGDVVSDKAAEVDDVVQDDAGEAGNVVPDDADKFRAVSTTAPWIEASTAAESKYMVNLIMIGNSNDNLYAMKEKCQSIGAQNC